MTVRTRIDRHFPDLSPSERRIARVIAERYPVSALGGIEDIAQQAQVSAPTVTRFVRQLGFARFADFQRAIRIEVQDAETSPLALMQRHRAATPPDDPPVSRDGRLMADLAASLDGLTREPVTAALDRATDLVAATRGRIWTLGGRWSSIAAQYLAFQLGTLRGEVHALVPPASGVLEDRIADFTRRDLLVVYDFRRYQPDIIAFAQAGRARRLRIVLFTDPELSPICDLASASVPVPVATTSPLDTLVPAIAATDALLARLVDRLGAEATKRMARLEDIRRGVGGARHRGD